MTWRPTPTVAARRSESEVRITRGRSYGLPRRLSRTPGDGGTELSRFTADGRHVLYFSFTCLTSVGFGEITPTNDHARSLVMIQQMVGVLYFALVVSRLVTLQSMSARRSR